MSRFHFSDFRAELCSLAVLSWYVFEMTCRQFRQLQLVAGFVSVVRVFRMESAFFSGSRRVPTFVHCFARRISVRVVFQMIGPFRRLLPRVFGIFSVLAKAWVFLMCLPPIPAGALTDSPTRSLEFF